MAVRSDFEPILINTPKEFAYIEVYAIHDLHFGNVAFDPRKWEAVKNEVLSVSNRYVIFVGDMMENAIPGSKSDVFTQTVPPQEQKEFIAKEMHDLADRTIAVVDGNHERNRVTKLTGLYPLYDCALIAGIGDRYRPHFAIADIGVGTRKKDPSQQTHYVVYAVHKAKDTKTYSSADFVDGIDAMVFGHTHSPQDIPRGKLVYDQKLKQIRQRSIETINAGSFMRYADYAVDSAYRPSSDKLYKFVFMGDEKRIGTAGFYV